MKKKKEDIRPVTPQGLKNIGKRISEKLKIVKN